MKLGQSVCTRQEQYEKSTGNTMASINSIVDQCQSGFLRGGLATASAWFCCKYTNGIKGNPLDKQSVSKHYLSLAVLDFLHVIMRLWCIIQESVSSHPPNRSLTK